MKPGSEGLEWQGSTREVFVCEKQVANPAWSAGMHGMNALQKAAAHLAQFETELDGLDPGPFVVEGVTAKYVATLLPRIRATFTAMSQLLQAGHHDEMVVLFRRQLEDSMRLHYLAKHTEQSDALILGHQRMRDMKVRRQLDRAMNNPETPGSMRPELKKMVARRRDRIEEINSMVSRLGIEPQVFPEFEDMAAKLGRAMDIIPYASASEVSHSAVSAATNGYESSSSEDGEVIRLIGLTSENPSDRLGYARAAINSTGMALVHGFLILDMSEEASYVLKCAAPRVEVLQTLQRETAVTQNEVTDNS